VNKVILNWQQPLWEGDQKVVKRSGRDEPMWVAIHNCMEAMLGLFLYSYLYPKLAKPLRLSYYIFCFLSNKIGEKRAKQVQLEAGDGRGRWHKVYTCK
jgi:hypothetical protein